MKNKVLSLFLLILAIVLSGCALRSGNAQDGTVQTASVTRGSIADVLPLTGNVESAQHSELNWQISGVVESVSVAIGDTVEKDQVLAVLRTDSMPAAIISSETEMIDAEEALDKLLISETAKAQAYKNLRDAEVTKQDNEKAAEGLNYPVASQSQIESAEKAMIGARDAYDHAKADYEGVKLRDQIDAERMEKYSTLQTTLTAYAKAYDLWQYYVNNTTDMTKSVAKATADHAADAYETALKEFKTYQLSFVRKEDQLSAEVKLDTALSTYKKRFLVADIPGIVTKIAAEEGGYVVKGTTGIRIDDTSAYYLSLNVSEVDVNRLQDGQAAQIVLDSQADKVYYGTVRYISSYTSSSSNNVTYRAVVSFDNPDASVKIGMTGEVRIMISEKADSLLIPSSALQTDELGGFVEVLKDGAFTREAVTTGNENNGLIEIQTGDLNPGDQVKVTGTALNTLPTQPASQTENDSASPQPTSQTSAEAANALPSTAQP